MPPNPIMNDHQWYSGKNFLEESDSLRDWFFLHSEHQTPEGTAAEWKKLIGLIQCGETGVHHISTRLAVQFEPDQVVIFNPKQHQDGSTKIPLAELAAWLSEAIKILPK